jgi:hypothetical protein
MTTKIMYAQFSEDEPSEVFVITDTPENLELLMESHEVKFSDFEEVLLNEGSAAPWTAARIAEQIFDFDLSEVSRDV